MILNYTYPQTRLFQFLQNVTAGASGRVNPLIIAPHYTLSRSGVESLVPTTAFSTTGSTIPFQYYDSSGTLKTKSATQSADLDFADASGSNLYGTGLEASVATVASPTITSAITSDSVVAPSDNWVGGTLETDLSGRPVQVGDIAYVTYNGGTIRRKVTGFRGVSAAATTGSPAQGTYNAVTAASSTIALVSTTAGSGTWATLTTGDLMNGAQTGALIAGNFVGDTFTFTVVSQSSSAGYLCVVNVTSASGLYSGQLTCASRANNTANLVFTGTTATMGGATVITLDRTALARELVANDVLVFTYKQKFTRIVTTSSGTYTGAANTTFLVSVLASACNANNATPATSVATLQISDTAGLITPFNIASSALSGTTKSLGFGVSIIFPSFASGMPQGALRVGDVYTIACVAATNSTTEFDKVLLDGPAIDVSVPGSYPVTLTDIEFRQPFAGAIPATAGWTLTADGVDVPNAMGIPAAVMAVSFAGWTGGTAEFANAKGTLALYYRLLNIAPSTEGLIPFTAESDIAASLGVNDMANDMGFGAREMLNGAQNQVTCYALRVNGRDATAFAAALVKVENSNLVYAFAAVTDDFEAAVVTAEHCDTMSGPTKKQFRRCYVGTDSPGARAAVSGLSANINSGGLVTFNALASGTDFTTLGLTTGSDYITVSISGSVVNLTILTVSATDLTVTPPTPSGSYMSACVIMFADTPLNNANFVIANSKALASRRAANVWVENGATTVNGVTTVIPNRFLAAHIAGLRCALLPQQGLTRTQVTTITNAPNMYLRYSNTLLDTIAANGTWIVTQESEGSDVYIRHQLTSSTTEGALAYEDSVGVGVDVLSNQTVTVVNKYIGVKNLTPETMTDMRNELHDIYTSATQSSYGNDAGPLLRAFSGLQIVPDAILKDRARILVTWVFSLPFNIGDIYVNVVQDVTLAPVIS